MAGERLTKIEAAAREVERFIGAQYDRDTALRLAAAAIRALASPPPQAEPAPRLTRAEVEAALEEGRRAADDPDYKRAMDEVFTVPSDVMTQPLRGRAEPAPEAKGGARSHCIECGGLLVQAGADNERRCECMGRAGRGER